MIQRFGYMISLFMLVFFIPLGTYAQESDPQQILLDANVVADTVAFDSLYQKSVKLYGNQPDKANELSNQAFQIATALNDSLRMIRALNLQGVCEMILGNYETSLQVHQQVLSLNEAIGYKQGQINSLINIGNVLFRSRNGAQAEPYYLDALDLANEIEARASKSQILNNLGSYYKTRYEITTKKQEDLGKALLYLSEAYEMKVEDGDSVSILTTGTSLAELAINAGNLDEADRYLDQMEELSKNANMLDYELSVMQIRVSYFIAQNQYDQAIKLALDTYAMAKQLKSEFQLATTAAVIAEVADSLKNYSLAYDYTKKVLEHRDKLYNENRQKFREELRVRYDLEKQQLQNDLLAREASIEQERSKRLRDVFYFALVGVVLLSVLLISQYRATQKAKRANLELKASNELVKSQSKQLKTQTEQVKTVNKELQKANEFREKLFSIIAHDLRSPINATQASVSMAISGDLDQEEFASLLPHLQQRIQSASGMLDNLLGWSLTQLKDIEFNKVSLNVHELIQNVLDAASFTADAKSIQLINEAPKDLMLQADEEAIKFIIRNFVMNAIKFSSEKQQIKVGANAQQLWVKDEGVGMPAEKAAKLFTKRADSTQGTGGEKGSGLGLMLCNDIALSMGAKLQVESQQNQGSTFRIFIG